MSDTFWAKTVLKMVQIRFLGLRFQNLLSRFERPIIRMNKTIVRSRLGVKKGSIVLKWINTNPGSFVLRISKRS